MGLGRAQESVLWVPYAPSADRAADHFSVRYLSVVTSVPLLYVYTCLHLAIHAAIRVPIARSREKPRNCRGNEALMRRVLAGSCLGCRHGLPKWQAGGRERLRLPPATLPEAASPCRPGPACGWRWDEPFGRYASTARNPVRSSSSRSDGATVTAGFNPRIARQEHLPRRVATTENGGGPDSDRFRRRYATRRDGTRRGSIPWVKTHGYHEWSLRDRRAGTPPLHRPRAARRRRLMATTARQCSNPLRSTGPVPAGGTV